MKKITYIIFTLLLIIPLMVNAEIRDIELEKQLNIEYSDMEYRGEYFISTYKLTESDDNYFKAYNFDGTIIHETIYEGGIIGIDENYVYTMIDDEEKVFQFFKYENLTGKKVAELEVVYEKEMDIPLQFFNDYGIVIRDWWDNDCFIVDKDLTGYEEATVTNEILVTGDYTPERTDYVSEEEYLKIKEYLLNNGFYEDELSLEYAVELENQYYTAVTKEGNIISIIGINKDLTEHSIKPIDNDDFLTPYTKYIEDLYVYDNKLSVVISDSALCDMSNEVNHIGNKCTNNTYIQVYKIKYAIQTKSDGNGTISVAKPIADSGEEITFTVEPKEGYVLGEVKVTDANGNVVIFKDYTFTMPSADVTIEATFVKEVENSETSDSTIMMFIATIAILVFIFASYKKEKYE